MVLTVTVVALLSSDAVDVGRVGGPPGLLDAGPYGILQAGGLLFFAFAGYARIATLGEEVRDPARTIPRAITIALGRVTASTRQPQPPSTFTARGQARSSRGWVTADALAIA